jgi:hypothetical protein
VITKRKVFKARILIKSEEKRKMADSKTNNYTEFKSDTMHLILPIDVASAKQIVSSDCIGMLEREMSERHSNETYVSLAIELPEGFVRVEGVSPTKEFFTNDYEYRISDASHAIVQRDLLPRIRMAFSGLELKAAWKDGSTKR